MNSYPLASMILRLFILYVFLLSVVDAQGAHNSSAATGTEWKGSSHNGLHSRCDADRHCPSGLECKEKNCVPKGAKPTPVPSPVPGAGIGSGKPKLKTVHIAGIVIGVIALIAGIVFCAFAVRRKRAGNHVAHQAMAGEEGVF